MKWRSHIDGLPIHHIDNPTAHRHGLPQKRDFGANTLSPARHERTEKRDSCVQARQSRLLMKRKPPDDVIAISNEQYWGELGVQMANTGVTASG